MIFSMEFPFGIFSSTTISLILSVFLLLRYYIKQKWIVLQNLNVPHDPPSIRNLGHAKMVWSNQRFIYELECKKKYGWVWGFYIGTRPRIVLHDINMLRQVIIKDAALFNQRDERAVVSIEELDYGLLTVVDDQWKRIRKTIAPAFSCSKLKQMMEVVEWCVDNTIRVLKGKIETHEGCFISKHVFSRLSLDVICSAAFSTNVNSQDISEKEPEISKQARKIFEVGYLNILFIICLIFPSLGTYMGKFSKNNGNLRYFREVCNSIMDKRKYNHEKGQSVDLMHLMLDSLIDDEDIKNGARKGMTKIEIIGNSVTMLLRAYDTTATTMSNLAYNLAQHQDVQKQLQYEIDEMYNNNGDDLDYSKINQLKYLNMCIYETLRLYPPLTISTRLTRKEITISGLTISAGMLLINPISAFCHDPEYWEGPMDFRPKRMENMNEIDAMIFQPFGNGPRSCIGKRYALMEIKVAFCKLLRHYSFDIVAETPEPPLEMKFDMISQAKLAFKLKVVPRSEFA